MKLYGFSISALDTGKWSPSCLSRFNPEERAACIHWINGWMGSRVGMEAVVKRKITSSAGNRTSVVQPTDSDIQSQLPEEQRRCQYLTSDGMMADK
jgi:hypothetical protein